MLYWLCGGLCGGLWVCCCVVVVVCFSLGVLKYVVLLCMECDGCCVFCLYCEAWSSRYSCKCECFVMQMMYVCVLCVSCGSSQCCVLHDLQFADAGQGYKRRPYGRDILQGRSHHCLVGSHDCLLLFTPSCCGE